MNSKPIPCHVVMERLWAFIDGQLEPASENEVREHLEMCAMCYPRYDFQRAYFRLMGRLVSEPEPAEVRSRIFAALLEETA